ncbi:MAG: STAS domain-containing protein [Gammaproteobacteria bacterium]|nr:STAS domain-containing protein [Gammaproteobacteria bacterium]NNJ49949.1 STAS domain-containing protein [Gammaproteobacteria bacterium]
MQKSQAEVTQQNKQKYLISGTVDFSTVPDLLRKISGLISASDASEDKPVMIDLSQVLECNSAALALMLEIVESAKQKNIELYFENMPATISTIARAYGVEDEIREYCR